MRDQLSSVKEVNSDQEFSINDQKSFASPDSLKKKAGTFLFQSAEKKGFFIVKQPSLVSTGNFVVPETLTVSPERPSDSFRAAIEEEVENEDLNMDVDTFHHSVTNCLLEDMVSL